MKKKILIPVLAVLVFVFVLQIASVISENSYAAALKGSKCKECYPVCLHWCPILQCGMGNVCLEWGQECFDVPCGVEHDTPSQD